MNWQDADRTERMAWFNFHGAAFAAARAKFVAAALEYAREMRASEVTERDLSVDEIMAQGMDAFDAMLAEEVRRDLGV